MYSNKKESLEKTKYNIEELQIDNILKEKLLDVNNLLYKFTNIKDLTIPNIIIDNFSEEEENILIEYITKIIEEYKLYKRKIQDYKRYDNIESQKIIVVKDFTKELDTSFFEPLNKKVSSFLNKVNKKESIAILITEETLDNDEYNFLKKEAFIRITKDKYTNEEIYERLINKYKDNKIKYNLPKEEIINLIKYIIDNNYCKNSSCINYLYEYSRKNIILENKKIITLDIFNKIYKKEEKKEDKEALTNLNNMIGLSNVKKEIKSLENYLKFIKKTNTTLDKIYLNMFFLGNPGTGKTTVARHITHILYKLEFIKEDKIVEVIPTDFMANYVGQTKDKTRKILDDAKDGILFIDEAYLLNTAKSSGGSFMEEAIVELLKYLEDPSHIVIFAGYTDEMHKIYNLNPGIKSRIAKEIIFDNYNSKELFQILTKKLNKINIKISNNAKTKLLNIFNNIKDEPNFGNARYCEQLAEQLVINHANRNLSKETYTITEKDIIINNKEVKKVGFIK